MESSPFLLVQPWWRVGKVLEDLCHSKAAIPPQPRPLQTSRPRQCVALALPGLLIADLALSSVLVSQVTASCPKAKCVEGEMGPRASTRQRSTVLTVPFISLLFHRLFPFSLIKPLWPHVHPWFSTKMLFWGLPIITSLIFQL